MPIMNPILNREIRSSLRSSKAIAIQMIFLAVLCLIAISMYPGTGVLSISAAKSRALFTVFAVGQLALIVLFCPAFTAASITLEKEQNSFNMLFTTLLGPVSIIVGKLFAAIAFLLILVVSSLPVSSVCFLLGGVNISEMLYVYAILVASAVTFGLIGLTCSSIFRNSYTSMIVTYLILIAVCAATFVPSLIFRQWSAAQVALQILRSFSPFEAVISVVQPDLWKFLGHKNPSIASWQVFLVFCAATVFVLVLVMYLIVKRPPKPRQSKREELIDERSELFKRRLKFPFYLIDPQRRKKPIGRILNPIFIKELRSRAIGRGATLIRGMYICGIAALILMAMACAQSGLQTPDQVVLVAVVFLLGLVTLVMPCLTASAITGERERGNFDMLRMTPLRSRTILLGKLEVAVLYVALLIVPSFPIILLALVYVGAPPDTIVIALPIIAATILVAACTGLFCSSFMKKSSTATAAAYGIMAFLCLATLLPLFLGDVLSTDIQRFLLVWNPFVSTLLLLTNAIPELADLWKSNLVALCTLSFVFFMASLIRVRYLRLRGT